MSWSEMQDVSHANALLVSDCLAVGGRQFARATQDWDSIPAIPDRRYGAWSQTDAEKNGYELPQSPQSAALTTLEDGLGDDWWEAFESCQSKVELFPIMGFNTAPDTSPVDVGMNESFTALLASSAFDSVRADWTSCIVAQGVVPDSESGVLVPEIPAAGEEQLRVAAIDVACKESLNSVQKLADVEAQGQMAYIDEHESELKAYRDKVDDVLFAVRKVLATFGG
ncbi:hypothetical protein [Cryobacterium sp. PH31-O1]|uniref:hypothetical protein n=1 Tax=Cryobacterium sp. PH31-O1 TaxID=3046306 RepID=UPI0024BA856F|nr:hypothetical protein [Cryobacterium sp. PH31-O1]MDJ0336747.1 hypothetical protein [Cryobacterium sp. PH31-O1]